MHSVVQQHVSVGSRVRVSDRDGVEEYVIAPEHEVDAVAGRISINSPLGQAILGHQAGKQLVIRTPGGPRQVRVLEVS
jgi:transcription elongation factor GreA